MNGMDSQIISLLYNFIADGIVLFFVKKDLFPNIKGSQMLKCAVTFSASYLLWDNVVQDMNPYFKIFSKCLLIFLLLCIFFKIHSLKLLIKTTILLLLYMFLLAGSISFFLSCINIENIKEKNAAYKAMGVMLFNAFFLFLWKLKKKKEDSVKFFESNMYEIQLTRKGKKIVCQAMYDSGNLLSSEITGQGVCILSQLQAKKLLLPKEWEMINKFYDTEMLEDFSWKAWAKQFQSGIYILQYFTVGEKKAKMPGIMAEEIVVLKNKEVLVKTKGMLGISQEKLSEKSRFSVLLPADIFERENNRSIV